MAQNSGETAKRGKGKPFRKGQSGNPGGRPRVVAEIRELARQHGPDMIARLAEIAKSAESESAQVAAIKELLERAYGKSAAAPEDNDEAVGRIVRFITGFSNPNGGPKRG